MKLPFSIDLSGKTALVTGGGGVLGAIFSKALAACGAKVAIMNRSLDKGLKVAEQIIQDGGQAMALSCDVLDEAALQKAREEIHARFGPVDILI
ncbi:MAG: SDR family NAD(P)-dependent oxidoreductase, partial [Clostridia bacterium]|nr:SDR family NAD(P)-dependent oxidoreductase [Clostridia bacterium]